MSSLLDLPLLVLEEILQYAAYDELAALSRTCRFLDEIISNKVTRVLRLPVEDIDRTVARKDLVKPVMRLEVVTNIDPENISKNNDLLHVLEKQLQAFNLRKLGDLSLLINCDSEQLWHNSYGIYYHILLLMLMDRNNVQNPSVKKLEIQVDFLCSSCKMFLQQLSATPQYSGLRYFKLNVVNFNDMSTVGLYVHYLRLIFCIPSLEYFEMGSIPNLIFEELKMWFLPDNIYFSQIRDFEKYQNLYFKFYITITMLNKGFRFFGQGSSKKFQVSSQRSPWPNILSMIGAARTNIVSHSLLLLRTTARQVESMARQRLRQYLWLRMLHTRLCHRMSAGRLVAPRWSGALAGGAVLCNKKTNFDWEKERVSPAESSNYFGHIDQCRVIREKTIICKECHNRLRIDKEVENVNYCRCKDAPASVYGQASEDCDWRPFIERKDILVWRREHGTMKGNYEYKMYGNFDDVSADEFLSVQLDMSEFRLSWDTNTAQCVVIDSEADTEEAIVYYWEVNWPRFFSNRDYCCYRQTAADPDTGALLVLSRSVDHPGCPSKRKTWRVQDYFSVLVIKPHTTSDQPGLEFCLTGYENPGLQLPESIITWVAHRGMPDFMMNLRSACLKLRGQDQRSQEAAAKESPKVYPENSSYQQPMGQGRMYA